MNKQIPWLRVSVEGVVIVGSILLAFGLQAWWEGRDDAIRRRAVIEGLRGDFMATRADLDRVSAFHQRSLSSAGALMELGEDGPIAEADASLADSLFSSTMFGGSFDPPLGTLAGLIGSGDLDLLDDPELTVYLTGFQALVADLEREQRFMRELFLEVHRYLVAIGMGSEISLSDPYWDRPWRLNTDGISTVAHVPGFRTWISQLWVIYGNMTDDHVDIDARLALIEARLAALH